MSLETSTFISGFTETWPVTGDPKSQGDDHIRLIKSVLKLTFPTASKAFYFPTTEAISGTLTLDATDQNNVVEVTTTGGNVVVNLPAALGVGDKGWSCQIVKVSNDANAAIVTPASGNINSKAGATATIRVGILCEPATLTWNGTSWRSSKPGPMIGSTENFDGAAIPPGYLNADGAAYSTTNFAELFAVLASGVVKDKRGRVEAGVDNGAVNRLTAAFFGTASSLGAVRDVQSKQLVRTDLPNVAPTFTGTLDPVNVNSTLSDWARGPVNLGPGGGTGAYVTASGTIASSGTFTPRGVVQDINGGVTQTAFATIQPTIIVNKIVRAC